MKKSILKNVFSILIASVFLLIIILLADNTDLFDGLDEMEMQINFSGLILGKILLAIIIILLTSNIVMLVLNLFRSKPGRIGTLSTVLTSFVKYIASIIGFCWILSIIGVNISTIFASVGIMALIIGFGAESLVADLVTGVFILFENQYNVGDVIEVNGFRGVVKEIGIRTLSLEDTGGNIMIINNSELKNIINRSSKNSVAVCDIGISYDVDLEKFDKVLDKILADIKTKHDVFKDRLICVGVESLAESSVVLRIIADVDEKNIYSARRLLNKELKIAFDKAGVKIPYPQIDVHNK